MFQRTDMQVIASTGLFHSKENNFSIPESETRHRTLRTNKKKNQIILERPIELDARD
jgi:hypothetical protein